MTLRLRLLGGASLERDDGTPIVGRAAQRHRIAVLALLACAPGPGLSRDKLIGLLWPESDAERARNLLNVSVYELRKALGDDAILSAGDELRLNPDQVSSDTAEFDAALARGDHGAAVSLYRGPLLDGFFLDDAPEFERWTDRARSRMADSYARSLEALADAAERRRDFRDAAEWWGRRAAHDPYDSRVALSLMRALDASGRRAGALQHASVHERLLRQELGLPAAAEVRALAEHMRAAPLPTQTSTVPEIHSAPPAIAAIPEPTVERAGATAAGAEPLTAHVDPAPDPPSVRSPPSLAPSLGASALAPRRVRMLAALLIGIAIVALVWALWPAAPVPERSIAVLPFVDLSPRGDNEYFSDGITEEIITQLSTVPELKVISRTSAMRYKGSTKSLRQIADELGVAHVLEGSVRREGDKLRITAQLIDAGADHHLWSRSYDREAMDVIGVQDEIAREVGRALEVELKGTQAGLTARGTRDPQAHELYRRGRFLWGKRTREAHAQAIDYYRRAIERDSSYAEPYSGLADAYLTAYQFNLTSTPEAEIYSRLKWAAERALALDDRSADAHGSVAIALWWQRNWPGAERELRRALELNPGHGSSGWYALLLTGMGRTEEAVQQSRRSSELDPFSLLAAVNHAWMCYLARDYDCAIERSERALELNDAWAPTYANVSLAYAQKGMDTAATRTASKAVELGGRQISAFQANLAYVHARAGRRAEAERFLTLAKTDPWEGFNIARVYVALEEPDSAFAWLERSSWQWPHRAVRADPALDPLRSDARFARLSLRVEREMGIR